jgi:nickel-dependent lactate racemase
MCRLKSPLRIYWLYTNPYETTEIINNQIMKVQLAYGRAGLSIDVPDNATILRPSHRPGLVNEAQAIHHSLQHPIQSKPLQELVKTGDTVVITHSDITRATPNDRILPIIIDELLSSGIDPEDITLLNALGTHRQQSVSELKDMLGKGITDHFQCIQHDAFDEHKLVHIGYTRNGNPVRINRNFWEANIRILTGFIEPHFFAGFSGGPKGVLPALAGAESVLTNHSIANISHHNATWGITQGNPIWEEMRDAAVLASPSFLVNVSLNAQHQITGVFSGDWFAAHAQGCEFVSQTAMQPVSAPFDVVITTNGGYPLDQNLYQCIKGLSAAGRIVRKGGAVILAGACEDGLPEHGGYASLLKKGKSVSCVLEMIHQPGFSAPDQWQVQIQAQIQTSVDVFVYSDGLSEENIRDALFTPCKELSATLDTLIRQYGHRLCILPEGPQTIPITTVIPGDQ